MKFNTLKRILNRSISFGVRHIEFSGGGEPLQYKYIPNLFNLLKDLRKRRPSVRFGILSNILHFKESYIPDIKEVFSYIRASYAEGIQGNTIAEDIFINNLRKLLNINRNRDGSPRIGLKLLANKKNMIGSKRPKLIDDLLYITT